MTELYISIFIMLFVALFPTGLIFCFLIDRRDIRKFGSGNIGGTNVGRVYKEIYGKTTGRIYGSAVILLDALKAAFIISFIETIDVTTNLGPNQLFSLKIGVGILVILINIFNPILKFKAGKGVATGLGVLIGLDPKIAALAFFAFILMLGIHRFNRDDVFKASITGAVTAFVCSITLGSPILEILFLFILIPFIIYSHRENIDTYKKSLKKPLK
ncbi:MAG: glycerol-3-phosphate acyltransferase PlsY [Parcubacteria group bacterium LiPW_41]|nr:MAG: glycerol-3-phosphate acyltransferase PlsY [Parcubacteria group bacterium LiPW_41]